MNTKLKKYLALLLAICIAVLSVPLDGAQIASFFAKADVESEEVVDDDDLADFSLVCGPEGKTQEEMEANEEEDEDDTDLITQLIESKNDEEEATTEETLTEVEADEEEPDISTTPYDLAYPDEFNSGDVQYASNSLLIKFKKSASTTLTKTFVNMGIGKLEAMFEGDDYKWYTAYLLKDADINDVMDKVRELDTVIVAEYNYVYETCATTDAKDVEAVSANEQIADQSVLNQCGIVDAWEFLEDNDLPAGGLESTIVAVIDTGVDYTHKDLMNNMWYNVNEIPNNGIDDDGNGYVDDYYGIDMTAGKGSAQDDNGHGTHVAGIIAATNNDIGVVGIAYNTKIMAIKAGDASGYFLQSNIANAIMYAYENCADVINMSFGGSAYTTAVEDALTTAYLKCVLVAAAGNNGLPNEETPSFSPAPCYPAAFTYVLGVMSCSNSNVESSFTNWDVNLYNNIEYEVYAPGEQVMSTLPGNRYGKLSGTSMACPVVAAQAALLRSYYTDHSTYPTKFIYGQIAGSSEDEVACCSSLHGIHNIPSKVDFYKSLTELPNPDLGFSVYTIFDTAGYSADTAGITAGCETINNGDGIVDAGETIALGFTIKNRWGMAKDTVVSISATNDLGVTNPYVTILNNDLDYGSVGTYSESDSGKIKTDGMWTGWQNPFYLKIADDCPNNYTITLKVSLTTKNALDESDEKIYTEDTKIVLVVRRGVILPDKITEDTTLTSDNYYILQDKMTIEEGATLTIEKGTKIQFWCSDPEDAYADVGIAYINVDGTLITNGTEDEPVEIFPSDWMDNYRVEITKANNASNVYLNYTNLTNPYIQVTKANHCEFNQTYYNQDIYYRYLSGGTTYASHTNLKVDGTCENCAFYKLRASLTGICKQCAFIDCKIDFEGTSISNLFIGNNNFDQGKYSTNYSGVTNYSGRDISTNFTIKQFFVNNDNGHAYAVVQLNGYPKYYFNTYEAFLEKYDISLANFETEDEYEYVDNQLYDFSGSSSSSIFLSSNIGQQGWINELFPSVTNNHPYYKYCTNGGGITGYDSLDGGNNQYQLFEFSANIFVNEIKLDKYLIDIDTGSYEFINATISPRYASNEMLIFESMDESIAKVDDNGKVTPVSQGSTQIKVSAPDRGVYNYVTVNVRPSTDLMSINISNATNNEIYMGVGKNETLSVSFVPSNTTQKYVTYCSSDENIVSVDSEGTITAKAAGDAIVTANGLNDISTSITIHCTPIVESISFKNDIYVTDLTSDTASDDIKAIELTSFPSDIADGDIVWTSTNPDVCYVDDSGKLIKLSHGKATITATAKSSGASASILVDVVYKYDSSSIVKICSAYYEHYALSENGKVYYWGSNKYNSYTSSHLEYDGDIKDIACYYYVGGQRIVFYYVNLNGELYYIDEYGNGIILEDISYLSEQGANCNTLYAIANDGTVYSWGSNSYGQMGTGEVFDDSWTPKIVDFGEGVEIVKIINSSYNYMNRESITLFLSNDGTVYVTGTDDKISTPTIVATNADDIISTGKTGSEYENGVAIIKGNDVLSFDGKSIIKTKLTNNELPFINGSYYIDEGKVYVRDTQHYDYLGLSDASYDELSSSTTAFLPIEGIDNAEKVFLFNGNYSSYSGTVYIATEDGKLYGVGSNRYGMLNLTSDISEVTTPILIDLDSIEYRGKLSIIGTNEIINSNVIIDESLFIDFDTSIIAGSSYDNISLKDSDDNSVTIKVKIEDNKLIVTPKESFESGKSYTLTVQSGSVKSARGDSNDKYTVTFTHKDESLSLEKNIYELGLSDASTKEACIGCNVITSSTNTINWSSSDETVVTVDASGNITAVGQGIAKITATIGENGLSDSCYVVVGNSSPVTFNSTSVKDGIINTSKLVYELNLPATSISSVKILDENEQEVSCSANITDNKMTIVPDEYFDEGQTYTLVIEQGAIITSTGNTNEEYVEEFSFEKTKTTVKSTNLNDWILNEDTLSVFLDHNLSGLSECVDLETLSGESVEFDVTSMSNNEISITPVDGFVDCQWYKLTIDKDNVSLVESYLEEDIEIIFIYEKQGATYKTQKDEAIESNRDYTTATTLYNWWQEYNDSNINSYFYNNAIINRLNYDDVSTWMRLSGTEGQPLGYNYWGTTNESLIDKQVSGYDYSNYLTTAPSETFPFVVNAYISVDGEEVDTVGNQEVKFVVEFNRAMDITENIEVAFGSAYPYRDYEVEGAFVSDTRWEGTITLTTLIENGYQYWSISGGRSAELEDGSHLKHYEDWGRFPFKIDTSSALSLTMQANATDTGIELTWTQDDYETLAGYNVYRSTSEDGLYTKLNTTVIPADTKTWFDDTVEPGVTYYYNFTVVGTDATTDESGESEPSGKVVCQAKDTMAPNVYHSPVTSAYMGSNLVINATITDNLAVSSATLYYRTKGADTWKSVDMGHNNDKYFAAIPSTDVTLDGIEYYIDAYDGISHTYKGTADSPYEITVQAALDKNSMGDVDGNGKIELKDAIMLLMAVNDRINLTEEQFTRADLDGSKDLSAAEALKIIMYVNGSISTLVNA